MHRVSSEQEERGGRGVSTDCPQQWNSVKRGICKGIVRKSYYITPSARPKETLEVKILVTFQGFLEKISDVMLRHNETKRPERLSFLCHAVSFSQEGPVLSRRKECSQKCVVSTTFLNLHM